MHHGDLAVTGSSAFGLTRGLYALESAAKNQERAAETVHHVGLTPIDAKLSL